MAVSVVATGTASRSDVEEVVVAEVAVEAVAASVAAALVAVAVLVAAGDIQRPAGEPLDAGLIRLCNDMASFFVSKFGCME